MNAALSPLRPREFFARPWQGAGEWQPRRWARRLPQPRRLTFRSWTTSLTETSWLVHDDTVWEDGTVHRRDGTAVLLAPGIEECHRRDRPTLPTLLVLRLEDAA